MGDYDKVPNQALRDAYYAALRRGDSSLSIARRAGIDDSGMRRALGVSPDQAGRYQDLLQERVARRLCDALDLYPVEIGF